MYEGPPLNRNPSYARYCWRTSDWVEPQTILELEQWHFLACIVSVDVIAPPSPNKGEPSVPAAFLLINGMIQPGPVAGEIP
jgi:hypothetical protein